MQLNSFYIVSYLLLVSVEKRWGLQYLVWKQMAKGFEDRWKYVKELFIHEIEL